MWKRGVITDVLGSKHYYVDVNGELWKRHIDQLIKCEVEPEERVCEKTVSIPNEQMFQPEIQEPPLQTNVHVPILTSPTPSAEPVVERPVPRTPQRIPHPSNNQSGTPKGKHQNLGSSTFILFYSFNHTLGTTLQWSQYIRLNIVVLYVMYGWDNLKLRGNCTRRLTLMFVFAVVMGCEEFNSTDVKSYPARGNRMQLPSKFNDFVVSKK